MSEHGQDQDTSAQIDAIVAKFGDWRGDRLAALRALITQAVPEIVEEIKWRKPTNPDGVPTWTCDGIVCTGEVYTDKVKLTFAQGASLPDPQGLFNASLGGNMRRAIDMRESDELAPDVFQALIRAAVHHNQS